MLHFCDERMRLQQELSAIRDLLKRLIERHEGANRELKASNEALCRSYDQLRSISERLQAIKAPPAANSKSGPFGDEFDNVLESARLAILIVGSDARIRRFTSSAQELLNLSRNDLGRPLHQVAAGAMIPGLEDLVAGVDRTLVPVEREVESRDGRWYALRISPYITSDRRIDGVLVAVTDIHETKLANRELNERDAILRAILMNSPQGIIAMDGDGRISMISTAAGRMFGFNCEEVVGRKIEVLLPGFSGFPVAGRGDASVPDLSEGAAAVGLSLSGRRRDGSEFPVEFVQTHISGPGKTVALGLVSDVAERNKAEEMVSAAEAALRQSQQQFRRVIGSLLSSQEEERQSLARDLHDDLNQRLAMLGMEIDVLERQVPDSADVVRSPLNRLRRAVGDLSEDVRRMAHALHPTIIKHFGLEAALSSCCDEYSKVLGILVSFGAADLPEGIPHDVALCLYRVTQECLSNVAKHSGAKIASVVVAGVNGAIHLVICDAGRGFAVERASQGLGLISVAERVRLAGGTLAIEARPGMGARIEVRIPLRADPQ